MPLSLLYTPLSFTLILKYYLAYLTIVLWLVCHLHMAIDTGKDIFSLFIQTNMLAHFNFHLITWLHVHRWYCNLNHYSWCCLHALLKLSNLEVYFSHAVGIFFCSKSSFLNWQIKGSFVVRISPVDNMGKPAPNLARNSSLVSLATVNFSHRITRVMVSTQPWSWHVAPCEDTNSIQRYYWFGKLQLYMYLNYSHGIKNGMVSVMLTPQCIKLFSGVNQWKRTHTNSSKPPRDEVCSVCAKYFEKKLQLLTSDDFFHIFTSKS